MDPYKVSKSSLESMASKQPIALLYIYLLLAFSVCLVASDSVISVLKEEGDIVDFDNYVFVLAWLAIMVWVGSDIAKGKSNPKGLMLLLIAIVLGFSVFDYQGLQSLVFGIGEAICYLAVFFLLKKPEVEQWFKPVSA